MKIITYLNFDGTTEEAFRFYERALGGKIVAMIPHAGTPAESFIAPEHAHRIMHARLEVGDQTLMASDTQPNNSPKPQGFAVSINVKDPDEATRIFTALSEGASITMPIQETFWSPRFGMLTDRFGIPWMLNCEPAA